MTEGGKLGWQHTVHWSTNHAAAFGVVRGGPGEGGLVSGVTGVLGGRFGQRSGTLSEMWIVGWFLGLVSKERGEREALAGLFRKYYLHVLC